MPEFAIKSIDGQTLYTAEPPTDFHGSSCRFALEAACRSEVSLYGANLQGADLNSAKLPGIDLRFADLRGANLHGAMLYHADLRHADLRHADLSSAFFYKSNLGSADLRFTNLHMTGLGGADLTFTKNLIDIGVSTRGNRWVLALGNPPMIHAGCHWFTLKEASEHWNSAHLRSPRIRAECLGRLALCETIAVTHGFSASTTPTRDTPTVEESHNASDAR